MEGGSGSGAGRLAVLRMLSWLLPALPSKLCGEEHATRVPRVSKVRMAAETAMILRYLALQNPDDAQAELLRPSLCQKHLRDAYLYAHVQHKTTLNWDHTVASGKRGHTQRRASVHTRICI